MFERIKSLMDRWHDIKEVDSLTERDLNDLGMSRDQVRAFIRMPHDIGDRVKHMAEIFGITDEELHMNHESYVDILTTCGSCKERGRCSHLLAHAATARPADASFCLNAETFAAQASQPAV